MTALKPTLCLGRYQRQAVPDLPHEMNSTHSMLKVRSQSEYIDALNTAFSHEHRSMIVLDKSNLQVTTPLIKGRTKAAEIIHFGEQDNMQILGDQWRILGLYSSNNFGYVNVTLHGQGGTSRKGIIGGTSNGYKDQHRGPVNDIWFQHVKVKEVAEQLFIFSGNSKRLKIRDMDLVHSGVGPHAGDHAEGFYFGTGSGSDGLEPEYIDIVGLYVAHINGGECFDAKVNAKGLRMRWFEFADMVHQYGAGLTLFIDNKDGGHGQDNDYDIADGYIHNIRSSKHGVSGVQAGAGGSLSRVLIDDIRDGYGVQTLRQAVGPNKVLNLRDVAIGRTSRDPISENGSTLSDKSQANSPMQIRPSGVTTTGTLDQMADRIWGPIASDPKQPTLPPPPIIVPPPVPVDPLPEPPAPATGEPIVITPRPVIQYDLSQIDSAIARLQELRKTMAAHNESAK